VNYKHAALLGYMEKYGVQRRRVGGRLAVLAAIYPSWRILYPNSGSFEGRSAVVGRDVPRQARGGC
jgi:hypothetical protein